MQGSPSLCFATADQIGFRFRLANYCYGQGRGPGYSGGGTGVAMRRAGWLGVVLLLMVSACAVYAQSDADRAAVLKTGDAIRAGFAAGDVTAILRYHHPEVEKALAFDKVLVGREAVAANLRETLGKFRLEFVENHIESLLMEGDTAVEQTLFTIRVSAAGTPAAGGGGASYEYKGRTMVVYVRYAGSPTGWAVIREVLQPAPNE